MIDISQSQYFIADLLRRHQPTFCWILLFLPEGGRSQSRKRHAQSSHLPNSQGAKWLKAALKGAKIFGKGLKYLPKYSKFRTHIIIIITNFNNSFKNILQLFVSPASYTLQKLHGNMHALYFHLQVYKFWNSSPYAKFIPVIILYRVISSF